MAKITDREEPVRSWYFDLFLLEEYWGDERAYHRTAPVNNVYALREALRLVAEESLEDRWDRHARISAALRKGLWALGLEPVVAPSARLPSLTTARLPGGLTLDDVVATMREEYDVEIATGLGAFADEAIRVGCMGHGARREPTLKTLSGTLSEHGIDVDAGDGVVAAVDALND
ncbi:aminotransferase class V-fold PLP-dependent enzyme [Natronomonas salsuginis]|uniref:Alanine--glyoxylate aminotransferase family protein n=1 Tax=Natronomonas salsuginis TaxID=2217661 RepID=A0A4U5J6P2_9EURY|nr:aminotransferase class V-fold PLP-dependent enzyme [Natronomonas salsuginis]TKR24680.1 alanine--glyoxylate aminotransferase family protein [Natronomonas salsuginis]